MNNDRKGFIFSILSKFFQVLSSFLIIKLLTTYLGKSDFGIYSTAMSIVALLMTIPFSVFDNVVFRFSGGHKDKSRLFTNTLAFYISVWGGVTCISVLYLSLFNLDMVWELSLIITPFFLLSNILFGYFVNFEKANQNQDLATYYIVFDSVFKIGLTYFIVKLDAISLLNVALVFSFSSLLVVIIFSTILKRFNMTKISLSFIGDFLRETVGYAKPIFFWSVFLWAQGMVYRVYLAEYSLVENVAQFSILSVLSILPITSLFSVLSSYISPKLYLTKGTCFVDVLKILNKYVSLFFILIIFWILILCFFAEEFVVFISSEEYVHYLNFLPIMALSVLISNIGSLYAISIHVFKKTYLLFIANSLPGVISILGGAIIVKNHGILGAVSLFCFSYTLSGILNIISVIYAKSKFSLIHHK